MTMTAPGVYIQELPSGDRTLTGVSTSLTAFVGQTLRGAVDDPVKVRSWAEFERAYGGLWVDSVLSQTVRHYFLNGGSEALVVRVVNADRMVLQATAAAAALAGFDRLRITVSGVAGSAFALTVEAVDAAGTVLDDGTGPYSVTIAVDLGASPATAINSATTATTPPVSLVEVVGDVLTEAPPEQQWETAGDSPGNPAVAIGSAAATASGSVALGIHIRATSEAQALAGADHLTLTVANSNPAGGTFDLTISVVDAAGTPLNDGAADYTVTCAGLDITTDYAAAIEATTTTTTPISLAEVVDGGPAVVPPNGTASTVLTADGTHDALLAHEVLAIEASSPGEWGNRVQVRAYSEEADTGSFHLVVTEVDANAATVTEEVYYSVTSDPAGARSLGRLLDMQSQLARLAGTSTPSTPDGPVGTIPLAGGGNGSEPRVTQDITGSEAERTGMYALLDADLFNLLSIPLVSWSSADAGHLAMWSSAAAFCERERAFLLVDPPDEWSSYTNAIAGADTFSPRSANAALYFPRVRVPDPLHENRLGDFPPCGVVAGAIARTDGQRGIWKAPAGIDVTLTGVAQLTVTLTDPQQGDLNQLGINCLRSFPVYGRVVWGARTLNGADVQASEWKYVPVRRLALYLEESLLRGSRWAVFEPNGEALWADLRLSIGSFMHQLFRQGAFAGASPQQAYFVKCDGETTTQSDIDRGIVNILIGFAPLKPAEFVIIKLQQLASQAAQ